MTDNRKLNKINIVIAIAVAFIAWIFVVYNYSPMKNVTYTNVPITYEGMDQLANRGYAISSTTDDSVDVVLSVERKRFTDYTAENIKVTADVSQAVDGNNGVSLEVVAPEGSKLVKLKQRMISVEVAACVSKDIDVVTAYSKNIGDGTEPVATSMSYRRVTAVGIQENIDKVSYAVIRAESSSLSDDPQYFVLNPVAVDEKGREVPHVLLLPSEISTNLVKGEVKEVDLEVEISNVPNGVLYSLPDRIKIKGTAEALKSVTKIEAEPVDLSGMQENTTISIKYILPEGIEIAQASIGKGVIVTKEK